MSSIKETETATPIPVALVPLAHVHKGKSGGILRHFSLSSNMTLGVSGAGTLSRSWRRGAWYWGIWRLNCEPTPVSCEHSKFKHLRSIQEKGRFIAGSPKCRRAGMLFVWPALFNFALPIQGTRPSANT